MIYFVCPSTMGYSFEEHTADVRMNVEEATLPALFEQSLAGMFSFIAPAQGKQEVRRTVLLQAPDLPALLVDFLNEALSLAQSHKESYHAIRFEQLTENQLKAELLGRKVSSFGDDIKAVTYHEAAVDRLPQAGWRAHVIFDV